jgi:hypothetical protein
VPYDSIADLPSNIRKLGSNDQRRWMHIWNDSYQRCLKQGRSAKSCESFAFANANGVVLKGEDEDVFDDEGIDMDEDALLDALGNLSEEEVRKAVLTAKKRGNLDDSDFAYIDSKGGRHLPMYDESHVRSALGSYGSQQKFESAAARRAAAKKLLARARKFGIEVKDSWALSAGGDGVSKSETGFFVTISKADVQHGVIYGVVNVANLVDHQQDFTSPEELQKACWGFMEAIQKGELDGSPVDDTHQFGDIPGTVVECWIDDDENWRIGYKPDDIEIAKAAARGDYVGWSMFGLAERVAV